MQRTLETVKTTLRNKKKVGGFTLSDLEISSKVWYWHHDTKMGQDTQESLHFGLYFRTQRMK